jgi:hypothetical protein
MVKLHVDTQSSEEELDELVQSARQRRRRIDAIHGQAHVPNQIPGETRVNYVLWSLALILYGAAGLAGNVITIPTIPGALHFQGLAAWVLFAAILAAAASWLSVVLDHYDESDNESQYRNFALWSETAGYALALVATALHFWR